MYLTYNEKGYSLGRVMKFMNEQFGYGAYKVVVQENFNTIFDGESRNEIIKLLIKSLYNKKFHPSCNNYRVYSIDEDVNLHRSTGGSLLRTTTQIISLWGDYGDNSLITIGILNTRVIKLRNETPEDYIIW